MRSMNEFLVIPNRVHTFPSHSKKTSDFPFICLGYKLPPGLSMALAVSVKDYGWYSIPLSSEDTGPFPFPVAGSFFDELYNVDQLNDDDK